MRSIVERFKCPNWCRAAFRATYVLSAVGGLILIAGARLSLAGFRADENYWEWLGRITASMLCHLGGGFTKVGQIVSTRYDVWPAPFLKQMQAIQDRVPPFDSATARSVVVHAFNRPLESVFQYFDDAPIASGTVAQIHYAVDQDGRELAVKVRRPRIDDLFRIDTYLLRKMAAIAAALPFLRSVPVIETASEIGDLLQNQTDLLVEARWHRLFFSSLRQMPELIVPQTVDELCTNEVLTMEFLSGLHRLDDMSLPAAARRRAILTTLRAVYLLMFKMGLVHCDLHPGNIYLIPSGSPVLLDFGFCGQMKERERKLFSELFLCIAMSDGDGAARIVVEMALAPPSPVWDEESFCKEIGEIVSDAFGKRASNFLVGEFVLKLFSVQRRWNLRASAGFSQPLLSLLVFEGIVRGLYPDLDFQREALPFVLAEGSRPGATPLASLGCDCS